MPFVKNSSLWISSDTCTANSRVGHRIRICVARNSALTFSIAGAAKATVLPEPVWDWPTTSRPAIKTGIDSAWMGEACSKPSLSMALRILGERPSSENSLGVISCLTESATYARNGEYVRDFLKGHSAISTHFHQFPL